MNKSNNLLVLVMLMGVFLMGCSNQKTESKKETSTDPTTTETVENKVEDKGPLPVFTFEKSEHDFGTMKEGDVGEFTFKFTNTGEAPLIISGAKGSCGCTVPEYPKEPIAVGESGLIRVSFNSNKKVGKQNKTVTLTANTFPTVTKLKIKADVLPKASPNAVN